MSKPHVRKRLTTVTAATEQRPRRQLSLGVLYLPLDVVRQLGPILQPPWEEQGFVGQPGVPGRTNTHTPNSPLLHLLSFCHTSAMLLPTSAYFCHASAMLLPCFCLLLPCFYHTSAYICLLLPCFCHASAILLPTSAYFCLPLPCSCCSQATCHEFLSLLRRQGFRWVSMHDPTYLPESTCHHTYRCVCIHANTSRLLFFLPHLLKILESEATVRTTAAFLHAPNPKLLSSHP